MPDQTNHHDPLDRRLRDLVATASADTPAPPDPATFDDVTATRSGRSRNHGRHRRNRWLAGGAVALAAAAAAVAFVVIDDEPTDVLVPATPAPSPTELVTSTTLADTTPSTALDPTPPSSAAPTAVAQTTTPSTVPATTAPATTAPPNTAPPQATDGATLLGISMLDPGLETYQLDFAVSVPTGRADGGPVNASRWRTSDGAHAVVLTTSAQQLPFAPDAEPLAVLDGDRPVIATNAVEGCSSISCSVALRWDDTTFVTLQWLGRPGTEPDIDAESQPYRDRLVEFAERLTTDPSWIPTHRPAVTRSGPTVSRDGIVVADSTGVSIRDGWEATARQLTDEPATNAVPLPDGRVIVTGGEGRGAFGDLFIVEPTTRPGDELTPFWIDGVPDDGSARIEIQDAATIDGEQTIVFTTTIGSCIQNGNEFRCDGTLDTATVPPIDGVRGVGRTVIRDLGIVAERGVDVDLRDGVSLPSIVGVYSDLTTAVPYFTDVDGSPSDVFDGTFEDSYSETNVRIHLDPDGFLVDVIDDGPLRIRDVVGDGTVTISLDGLLPPAGFTREPAPVLDLTPVLWRDNGRPAGSVWVTTYVDAPDDPDVLVATAFLQIALDGTVVGSIVTSTDANVGATLNAANR